MTQEVQHPPGAWLVRVGWTSTRPVQPDEHTSYVTVWADDEVEASLVAAQMVAVIGRPDDTPMPSGRPSCVMPTRTTILRVLL